MNNYDVKKNLSKTYYKRLILFGKGYTFGEIAIKENIQRDSIITCFWKIRAKLERLNLIPFRKWGEKYSYNYLKEFAENLPENLLREEG